MCDSNIIVISRECFWIGILRMTKHQVSLRSSWDWKDSQLVCPSLAFWFSVSAGWRQTRNRSDTNCDEFSRNDGAHIPGNFQFRRSDVRQWNRRKCFLKGTHSFDSWTEPIGSPKVLERQLDWVDAPFEFSKCVKCGARFTTTHRMFISDLLVNSPISSIFSFCWAEFAVQTCLFTQMHDFAASCSLYGTTDKRKSPLLVSLVVKKIRLSNQRRSTSSPTSVWSQSHITSLLQLS